MKIALFGSTGRVGSLLLQQAIEAGYDVKVLVRDAAKLAIDLQERVEVLVGDVKKESDVFRTIEGVDVVMSALGTDKTTTLTEATAHFIQAMERYDIRRIVTVGTAGILNSRTTPGKLRYEAGDTKRKLTFAAEEHHKVYEMFRKTDLDWTIVCPTYLPDGEALNDYIVEKDYLPEGTKRITVGDTAQFVFKTLHEQQFVRSRVGICDR